MKYSKKRWIKEIKRCPDEPCPLCVLVGYGKKTVLLCECCPDCIFSIYKHFYFEYACCVAVGAETWRCDIEEHRDEFLLPFVEALPADHPFFRKAKSA